MHKPTYNTTRHYYHAPKIENGYHSANWSRINTQIELVLPIMVIRNLTRFRKIHLQNFGVILLKRAWQTDEHTDARRRQKHNILGRGNKAVF